MQKYGCPGAGWDVESKGRAAGKVLDYRVFVTFHVAAEASAIWDQVCRHFQVKKGDWQLQDPVWDARSQHPLSFSFIWHQILSDPPCDPVSWTLLMPILLMGKQATRLVSS